MENSTNKQLVWIVVFSCPRPRRGTKRDQKCIFGLSRNQKWKRLSQPWRSAWLDFWRGFRDAAGMFFWSRMIVGQRVRMISGERGSRRRRRKLLTLQVLGGVGHTAPLHHITATLQTSQLDVESRGGKCLHLSYNQSLTIICFSRRSLGVVRWVAASSGGGGICIQLY